MLGQLRLLLLVDGVEPALPCPFIEAIAMSFSGPSRCQE